VLPLCTLLSGTPTAQFVQPLTGGYFTPIYEVGYPNYIKVNAEAAQGSTDITSVEVHAIHQSTGTDTLLGVDNVGVNPFEFVWPHNESWTPTLPDGLYTFSAIALDANNLSTYPPTTVTNVTIDSVRPGLVVQMPFTENAGVVSTTITATDLGGLANSGISYVYMYSEAEKRTIAYCSPASGTYPTTFNCNVSFTPTVIPWDLQRFQVTAIDRAGNNRTVYYYSDTVAPVVDPFTVTMSGSNATATIHATDTNPAGTASIKKIQLYSAAKGDYVGSCDYSTPYSASQTCVITFVPDVPLTTNYFNAVVTDVTGNAGYRLYDPDTVPPTYTWFSGSVTNTYNSPGTYWPQVLNAQDVGSGLDYVQVLTYIMSGSTRVYTTVGTCDYNGETSAQNCTIMWGLNSTTWPNGSDYYMELRIRDVRGRMISPSWGPITIN